MTQILITGGTGKTGRRVARQLTDRGVAHRVAARGTTPRFDWTAPETWPAVLQGIDSVYLVYYPDLAFPGAAQAIGDFATHAVANGVRRIVLLSGRGEEESWPAEDAVRGCGAEWTVLRASWLNQNFSEHFLLEPVRSGVIALPAGNVTEPFVDADDIAEVAVAALTEHRHAGQTYELTGPELLSFGDAVDEIAKATGRPVRYLPVTPEQYAAAAAAHGVPADEVEPLTALFTKVLDGRNEHLTDGVFRALGRDPRQFAGYARAAAATGVWDE